MSWKYEAPLRQIPDCPASHFAPGVRQCFRFVFSADLAGSFYPPLFRNPRRALKLADLQRCSGWALSFYATDEQAASELERLRRTNPRIHRTIGESLATGALTTEHGAMDMPDVLGHFDLHEYADVELYASFTVVRSLV
jgi:hypothetical protein